MRSEGVPRRVESEAPIQVVIIVRQVHGLEVDRAGEPGRVLLVGRVVLEGGVHVCRRYSGPVNERTINGDMLELAGADVEGEGQHEPGGECSDLWSFHFVLFNWASYRRRQGADPVCRQERQTRALRSPDSLAVEKCRSRCRNGPGSADSFPPAVLPAWSQRIPGRMSTDLFPCQPVQCSHSSGRRIFALPPDGPRTVPVRSAWPGAKGPSFCSPPQRADILRTGTVRGPGHFRDAPPSGRRARNQ